MQQIKLASFNIEWMNDFFYKNQPKLKNIHRTKSGRIAKRVTEACRNLRKVFDSLNPDVCAVLEGPDSKAKMELFVATHLDGAYKTYHQPTVQNQHVHILVKKSLEAKINVEQVQDAACGGVELTGPVSYTPWGETSKRKKRRVYRKPCVIRLSLPKGEVEIIALHIKSKHSLLKRPSDLENPQKVLSAVSSHQKIAAEMTAIRNYLDAGLSGDGTANLVVMGDLNDGPNRQPLERLFMQNNLLDILGGSFWTPSTQMHPTLASGILEGDRGYTAVFSDPMLEGRKNYVLLDHILISPALTRRGGAACLKANSGGIGHEVFELLEEEGVSKTAMPSDHRPVFATLNY